MSIEKSCKCCAVADFLLWTLLKGSEELWLKYGAGSLAASDGYYFPWESCENQEIFYTLDDERVRGQEEDCFIIKSTFIITLIDFTLNG